MSGAIFVMYCVRNVPVFICGLVLEYWSISTGNWYLLEKGAPVTQWVAQGRRQLNFILWIVPFILFAYQFTEWFTIYRPLPYRYQSGTEPWIVPGPFNPYFIGRLLTEITLFGNTLPNYRYMLSHIFGNNISLCCKIILIHIRYALFVLIIK
jgi:hypothetical protein